MKKAIFLDRDGTINTYVQDLSCAEQVALRETVSEAIAAINHAGCLAIVITNQPVVAKGMCSPAELERIHAKMSALIAPARLDAIYVCPHYPEKGFAGEVPELKITCDCRKPKPGLLLKAAKEHQIDLAQSWFIGDSLTDIRAGQAAGVKTILLTGAGSTSRDEAKLIETGSIKPNHIAHTLLEAAQYALRRGAV